MFKELSKDGATLVVTMTCSSSTVQKQDLPWKFGFNFDMNSHPAVWGRQRGTCMISTPTKPSKARKEGQGLDTPEYALKWDKDLKATSFRKLGDAQVRKMEYAGVKM